MVIYINVLVFFLLEMIASVVFRKQLVSFSPRVLHLLTFSWCSLWSEPFPVFFFIYNKYLSIVTTATRFVLYVHGCYTLFVYKKPWISKETSHSELQWKPVTWSRLSLSKCNGQILIINKKKDWERFWPQWTSRES
jgi:hypothetical protein